MNIKTVLLCTFTVLCTQTGLVWGGPIYKTVPKIPSDLNTPLAKPGKNYMYTHIACVNAYTGIFVSCGYDFSITGLKQPDTDPANNGGHTHDYSNHPLGTLQVIWPFRGNPANYLYGQTQNNYVFFSHEIPQASGKIETLLNLRVPQGWYTVSPESCDAGRMYWCFKTTVDVGVATDLLPLADPQSYPGLSYIRVRNALGHTDDVAYFGTIDTLFFLNNIAILYRKKGYTLSVNDMSLPRGGLFDVYANYLAPHRYHRTGQSADINQDINGDCLENDVLRKAVDQEMPIKAGSPFAYRYFPSRFLCELGNNNNIHLDFDGMVF